MKKILVTVIGMLVGAALVHAQGYLQLTDSGGGVTTNTGTFGNPTVPNSFAGYNSIVSGKTATTFQGFDYAFLYVPTGQASSGDSNNLAASDWVQLYTDVSGAAGVALTGTNANFAGGFDGTGQPGSVQVLGAGSQAFATGNTYSIAVVAWSANLGTSWSTIANEYASSAWSTAGNFGYSIGSVNPSSGIPGTAPTAIWPNSTLVLYSVAPVPEPATIALAGLGGLSMLFLRRRKS